MPSARCGRSEFSIHYLLGICLTGGTDSSRQDARPCNRDSCATRNESCSLILYPSDHSPTPFATVCKPLFELRLLLYHTFTFAVNSTLVLNFSSTDPVVENHHFADVLNQATVNGARLVPITSVPKSARIADAISDAEKIMRRIDAKWPARVPATRGLSFPKNPQVASTTTVFSLFIQIKKRSKVRLMEGL